MNEEKNVDPSALGLLGLGVVTLVASSVKFGLTDGVGLLFPWALFLGGIAQIIAGIYDYKKCNAFGATAFIAYGLFWCSMCFSWLVTAGVFGKSFQEQADPKAMGVGFIAYLIITLFLTVGSTRTNKVLFLIFIAIDFLFIGLAFSTFGIVEGFFHNMAAVSELIISLLAFYGAAANIINKQFGYEFLKIGGPINIFLKK